MSRTVRCGALFLGFVALVAVAHPTSGQEKKDKDKKAAKWEPSVEFTSKSPKEWLLREPKPGIKMVSDKDYVVTAAPNEVAGSTYLVRTAADHGQWLPDGALKAKKDVIVYAIVRVKMANKETFGEVQQSLLTKDGWREVEGKTATTSPNKEPWEWKTFKKELKEGDVSLPLENLKWPGTAVLFFFK